VYHLECLSGACVFLSILFLLIRSLLGVSAAGRGRTFVEVVVPEKHFIAVLHFKI